LSKFPGQAGSAKDGEAIFRTFEFPLAAFAAVNPRFDPSGLSSVRLCFDRTERGALWLDDLALRAGN